MQDTKRHKIGLTIWLAYILLLCFFLWNIVVSGPVIESNIIDLLPHNEKDITSEKAFNSFSEKNMKKLIFLVGDANDSIAVNAANDLIKLLKKNEYIENAYSGMSQIEQEDSAKLIFSHRFQLISEDDRRRLLHHQTENFSEFTLQQLYSPVSGGTAELIQHDPFLLSFRFNIANAQSSGLNYKNGLLSARKDGNYFYLVIANLSESAFLPKVQDSVTKDIARWEERWQKNEMRVSLLRTGALFYAQHGFQSAQKEVSTIGVGSLIGIITLMLLVFRSLKPLLMVVLTILVGVTSGFVVVHQMFDKVHLITLVFGASLIGVAVDYAFHYLSSDSSYGNFHAIKKIFPAITLGLISSVIGYFALLTTPFPGLSQMAVFSISGLLGAFLTVILFLPLIKLNTPLPSRLLKTCDDFLQFIETRKWQKIWWFLIITPCIALLVLWHQPGFVQDIRQFQNPSQSLMTQQSAIQTILNIPESNQFYLVKAKSQEALLRKLESSRNVLDTLVSKDIIKGYQSLAQWVPSRQQQQENYNLYRELFSSGELEKIASSGIFEGSDIEYFEEIFKSNENNYLTLTEWLNSSMGKQLNYLSLGQIDGQYVAVVVLKGIRKIELLDNVSPDLVFVDKVSTISKLFQQYKESTAVLLLYAVGLIFLILLLRLGLMHALMVIFSPIVAISITFILLFLLAVPVTLFNTLALFLVLGIGVDYGVFFAEGEKGDGRILLAVILSALTTILSFGLLSLSQTPAIFAFGITMLIGISLCLILAPIAGNRIKNFGDNKRAAN